MTHSSASRVYIGLTAIMLLTGCSLIGVQAGERGGVEKTGVGTVDPALTNETQRRATAREAAVVVAKNEMLTYLKGLTYKDGSTVEDKMKGDPAFAASVERLATQAVIVSDRWESDDSCTVVIRLSKKKIRSAVGRTVDH